MRARLVRNRFTDPSGPDSLAEEHKGCPSWQFSKRSPQVSSLVKQSRCWTGSSLPDQSEDSAIPLHHLTGRGPDQKG